MRVDELPTPALVLDLDVVEANLASMAARWPGTTLRPHAKLFKSTAFAAWLADAGHLAFCCATIREVDLKSLAWGRSVVPGHRAAMAARFASTTSRSSTNAGVGSSSTRIRPTLRDR